MTDGLSVAMSIATSLLASVTAPLLLSYLNTRQRIAEKNVDYARQDEVAKQAKRVADQSLLLQQEALERTKDLAQLATTKAEATNRTLDGIDSQTRQIHTLVNSDMTVARQAELHQTEVILVLLKKIVALDEQNGRAATLDELAMIASTDARIAELKAILVDRTRQLEASQTKEDVAAHESA